ncbi:hypothetical protein D3C80_481000 [compost metagenome]
MLLARLGDAEVGAQLGDDVGWRCSGQCFGELADTAFDQQAPGQLDQIEGGDRPQPLCLQALRALALGLEFGQCAVVTLGIALKARAHGRRLCLPEAEHRRRRVQPIEEQVAGQVFALLESALLGTEVTRTLAVDGDHFVSQQAQVVLRIGIANTVPQALLVLGQDMRHAETGTADFGRRIARCHPRLDGKAETGEQPGHTKGCKRTRLDHAHSSSIREKSF